DRLDKRSGMKKVIDLKQVIEAARKRNLIASGDRGERSVKGNIAALDFFNTLLDDPELLKRPDGKPVEAVVIEVDPALFPVLDKLVPRGSRVLHFVDYTARRIAANKQFLAQVPAKSVKNSLILTLADDNVGVLPQSYGSHL